MSAPKRPILFITSSEHGQANVVLAVLNEILCHEKFDVYNASYADLQSRAALVEQSSASSSASRKVVFHLVPGDSMLDTYKKHNPTRKLTHAPGVRGTITSFRLATNLMEYCGDGLYT